MSLSKAEDMSHKDLPILDLNLQPSSHKSNNVLPTELLVLPRMCESMRDKRTDNKRRIKRPTGISIITVTRGHLEQPVSLIRGGGDSVVTRSLTVGATRARNKYHFHCW